MQPQSELPAPWMVTLTVAGHMSGLSRSTLLRRADEWIARHQSYLRPAPCRGRKPSKASRARQWERGRMKKAPPRGGAEDCADESWQTFNCDNPYPKASPKKLPFQVLASIARSKPRPVSLAHLECMDAPKQGELFGQPPPDRYPLTPGSKGLATSREAARKTASSASVLRDAVLAEIEAAGSLTADEVAARLDRSILVIRPRVSELHATGQIEPTAKRRRNTSGLPATVWRSTTQTKSKEYADEQAQSVIV